MCGHEWTQTYHNTSCKMLESTRIKSPIMPATITGVKGKNWTTGGLVVSGNVVTKG